MTLLVVLLVVLSANELSNLSSGKGESKRLSADQCKIAVHVFARKSAIDMCCNKFASNIFMTALEAKGAF